ncbi:ATP-grasp fold amidoligase family protein [Butyrivibrio sp. LB2008]|uniref:ATP-grasp fold amidoligase family protein n=1 Tax=Butyrivibrio sp. LB2008 TaxID=1408305 RepID=UPI00047A8D99|nr:ATP-grasp fold amidoligase family protein [Butyrivibrio sp. LB2008]
MTLAYRKYVKEIMPSIFYPLYLKYQYKKRVGKKLHFRNPINYTEKIQWAKINRKNPLLTQLSDKVEARKWVSSTIGEEYLIPIVGEVYTDAEDIDFDNLPEKYVIKLNTGSGFNIIVNDSSEINKEAAKNSLKKWMNSNYAYNSLELQYKDIIPRIYIEENLLEDGMSDLPDYKFFCFGGKVFCSYTRIKTYEGHTKGEVGFFDRDYNLMPYYRADYASLKEQLDKPKNYEKMVEIAEKLSYGFSHVRVDLYNISGKIYFGEMTFTTNSGYIRFVPEEFDRILGDQWNLNSGI